MLEGITVGAELLGLMLGTEVGVKDGTAVGTKEGTAVGAPEGNTEGAVPNAVGCNDGPEG